MKTNEELNSIKKELEELSNKLSELDDNELEQISGGEKKFVFETWVSEMVCDRCKFTKMWQGKFPIGKKYYCPVCKETNLECKENKCLSRIEI